MHRAPPSEKVRKRGTMKLCIPTVRGNEADAVICDHFGNAPEFTLYDQQTQRYETIKNPRTEHEHGQCRPMELLANRGIAAMICKGMGRNAAAAVERIGIKVFTTQGATVREAMDEFLSGRLIKLDPENSCQGHHCH